MLNIINTIECYCFPFISIYFQYIYVYVYIHVCVCAYKRETTMSAKIIFQIPHTIFKFFLIISGPPKVTRTELDTQEIG